MSTASVGYCQVEHEARNGVTYWCELRAGHNGPHVSGNYSWSDRPRVTE